MTSGYYLATLRVGARGHWRFANLFTASTRLNTVCVLVRGLEVHG